MNNLTIIGNLTRDPEYREVNTQRGKEGVATFSVAVNKRRGGENAADFFRVTVWGKMAQVCQKYLAKGRKVCVVGSVSLNTYQSHDGTNRASMEVTASNVEFLSAAANEQRSDADDSGIKPQNDSFTPVTDESLPF